MKALQAVLVSVLTHWAFCCRSGGDEMCFSKSKFASLITVVGGVLSYGFLTQQEQQQSKRKIRQGYERIQENDNGFGHHCETTKMTNFEIQHMS